MTTVRANSLYSRHPNAITADLGAEVAVLDLKHGSYRGLNETAAFIWRQLEAPITLDDLCSVVTKAFDVTEGECRRSLVNLLAGLQQAGLVVAEDA